MAPSRGLRLSRLPSSIQIPYTCSSCLARRSFTTTAPTFSGHSRWSKIKHDKAKTDASKNKQRSTFAQEIATASRLYGPTNNPRLSEILTKAIRAGFPKASIEKAIARGQGKSATGAQLETVTLEGVLPGNVAVVVESETDNRIRTLATLRLILKQAGGSASPCAYLFNKRGRIWFEAKEGIGEEEALEAALEAGASDVAEDDEEGSIVVWCEPGETKAVSEAVASSLGLQISTTDIVWVPVEETKIDVSPHTAQGLSKFADDLQERDSTLNAQATVNIRPGSLGDEAWVDLCKTLDARDVRYV